MEKIRGVLFDVDGTLVDSNDAHARAWVEAFAEHGIAVELERIRCMMGMGGDKILCEIANLSDESPRGHAIGERRRQIFLEKHIRQLPPCRGSRALVQYLHERGYQLAVASSAKAEELTPLLRIAGVEEFFRVKTSSDDAEASKPDPDIVEAALQGARLGAADAVLIGDTPYDIEAGQRAGVRVIALRCGGWRDDGLRGAVAIYDDPADLLAQVEESPVAQM
jgi:HAD superfamily hydrolase (TIGR01509 family)